MILNYIWICFFFIAFVVAVVRYFFFNDYEIFNLMINSTFTNAKLGFELSLGLTGVLTLWLGLLKVGEKGGMINIVSRFISPFFSKIFPELPKNHPAIGSMIMNIAANMLGLDNAATPTGLRAMQQLQEDNPNKETATNSQIMFLVLNTSGLTIIPVSIMVYRSQMGAANPADIFIPILLATYFSTLAGFLAVSIYQKINIFNKVVISYLTILSVAVIGIAYYFYSMPPYMIALSSKIISNFILIAIIITFIAMAFYKKVNVYEAFIEGAKDGFQLAIKIIPYLIAMLVAIGVFRSSGAMDFLTSSMQNLFLLLGINTDFVPALPTALMKPLSGSGARGMMIDTFNNYGIDSFAAKVAATMQGATDTTFYIIALYFGSVGVRKTRHAIVCGLIADFVGIIAAVIFAYLFFHGK